MSNLKEKDIVNYIINKWDSFFPELRFWKKELSLRDFRVDIAADFEANLKDLGIRDEDYICRPAVFFEVKYNSNMRDLMFELQKQIKFRDWYINYGKAFCMICVISDEFDFHMVEFMERNSIFMYKLSIKDDDINTMTIEEYTMSHKEIEEGNEVVLC